MGSSNLVRPRRFRHFRRAGVLGALLATVALSLTACFPPAEYGAPILKTATFVGGLNRPWDLAFLPNGIPIYTENDTGLIIARLSDADSRHVLGEVAQFQPNFSPAGEGGLMGLAVDPNWSTNQFVYVCYSTVTDNRVARMTLNPVAQPSIANWTDIVTGIPHAGFHNGCRVRFRPGSSDELFVSTGDAAVGGGPQRDAPLASNGVDLSLAGKILRLHAPDGGPYPGNPGNYLWYTRGHRNPQGIAFRPGTTQVFDAEHGPDRNDEVNLLAPGGNAGWNPTNNGVDYDQSKPMTNPAADTTWGPLINPTWRSGDSVTVAPSGATFLAGAQWKNWNGALVVACLDGSPDVGQRLLVMHLSADGRSLTAPPVTALALRVRLRAAVQGPDGDLYVVTDGDAGTGAIWKVTPI